VLTLTFTAGIFELVPLVHLLKAVSSSVLGVIVTGRGVVCSFLVDMTAAMHVCVSLCVSVCVTSARAQRLVAEEQNFSR